MTVEITKNHPYTWFVPELVDMQIDTVHTSSLLLEAEKVDGARVIPALVDGPGKYVSLAYSTVGLGTSLHGRTPKLLRTSAILGGCKGRDPIVTGTFYFNGAAISPMRYPLGLKVPFDLFIYPRKVFIGLFYGDDDSLLVGLRTEGSDSERKTLSHGEGIFVINSLGRLVRSHIPDVIIAKGMIDGNGSRDNWVKMVEDNMLPWSLLKLAEVPDRVLAERAQEYKAW